MTFNTKNTQEVMKFCNKSFQELGFYAPRTVYSNLTYNNKKYKFLFQEKLVKEFLEHNSLQEGIFLREMKDLVLNENVSYLNGKPIDEKEIGISKFESLSQNF